MRRRQLGSSSNSASLLRQLQIGRRHVHGRTLLGHLTQRRPANAADDKAAAGGDLVAVVDVAEASAKAAGAVCAVPLEDPGDRLFRAGDRDLEDRLGLLVELEIEIELVVQVVFLPAAADRMVGGGLHQPLLLYGQPAVGKVEPA